MRVSQAATSQRSYAKMQIHFPISLPVSCLSEFEAKMRKTSKRKRYEKSNDKPNVELTNCSSWWLTIIKNSLCICSVQKLIFLSDYLIFWLKSGWFQKFETFISSSFGGNCTYAGRAFDRKDFGYQTLVLEIRCQRLDNAIQGMNR